MRVTQKLLEILIFIPTLLPARPTKSQKSLCWQAPSGSWSPLKPQNHGSRKGWCRLVYLAACFISGCRFRSSLVNSYLWKWWLAQSMHKMLCESLVGARIISIPQYAITSLIYNIPPRASVLRTWFGKQACGLWDHTSPCAPTSMLWWGPLSIS